VVPVMLAVYWRPCGQQFDILPTVAAKNIEQRIL
jgi:hypothetical protein